MRKGERKKLHKHFVKLLRITNKNFINDDWFNGRFYLRLYAEYGYHYNDQYDSYPHPYIGRYGIMAIDKYNPLNVGTYLTDEIYFHSEYPPDSFQFERYHIHEFLNSWIQFCESGKVHDSPPHFNYGWMYDADIANKYIESLSEYDMKPKDIDVFINAIKSFNPINSKIYNDGDRMNEDTVGFDTFAGANYLKHKQMYAPYTMLGLCHKMKNGIILVDDNMKFLCAFFKANQCWYGCYFDDCSMWKPGWDDARRDRQLKGVKIGNSLLNFINKYDTDNLLSCWLILQKTQVLD